MARLDQTLFAVGYEWPGVDSARAAVGLTTTDSSYTEAGTQPGDAVADDVGARLVPVVSGEMAADLEIVTLASGLPVLAQSGGAELGWRYAGETASQIRGWIAPNWLTGIRAVEWTSTGATSYPGQAVTHPETQAVVIAYRDGTDTVCRVYSPGGHSLSPDPKTTGATTIRADYDPSDAIVCYPATGRIVAIVANRAYRSDDVGSTWDLHSSGVFSSDIDYQTIEHARAAASADGTAVWVGEDEATASIYQASSSDGLATLTPIGGTVTGARPCVAALPGSGYAVAWLADTTDYPTCARLAASTDPLDAAATVTIASTACDHVTIVADPDGLLTAYYSPSGALGQVRMSVSLDGGVTWTAYDEGCLRTLTSDRALVSYSVVASAGAHVAVGQSSADTATVDGTLWLYRLGGYSTVVPSIPGWTTARDFTARGGTGFSSGQSNCSWTPIELPTDAGWTAGGATGTHALADDWLDVQCSAGQVRSYSRDLGATSDTRVVMVEVLAKDGGDLAANEIALSVRTADGVSEREIVVRLVDDGQVRVRDAVAGSTLATVTTAEQEMVQILVQVSTSSAVDSGVWWRLPSETEWTEIWTGAATVDTSSPAATSVTEWGHISASAALSRSYWRIVACTESTQVGTGISHPTARGRPVSWRPYPLPPAAWYGAEGADGGSAWLSARSGPAALGESWSVPRQPTHPIERTIPSQSPSPSDRWRSVDKSEQAIVYDAGRQRWVGDSVALVALGANFRTAYLEYYSGAAWVTAGTLDLATGFSSLTGAVDGYTLTPGASTTAGARYLQEGELVGGYAIVETGGGTGTAARRIVAQTAGWWRSGTGQPEPRITLEGVDGTEDASGDVVLVWPAGVAVVHASTLITYRRWRIRIPASQVTPDSYYEAGVLAPMTLRLLGGSPAWGWSQETTPNAETQRRRDGATRTTRLGDAPTSWTWDYADGAHVLGLRGDGSSVDWLAPSGGYTSGGITAEDIGWRLRGILDATDSGAIPVVAIAAVPQTASTITDRTLWCYGRMTSSVRLDHVVGTEGAGEVLRVASITIEGIP